MKRKWFQIHLSTAIVISLVAGSLILKNCELRYWKVNPGPYVVNNDYLGWGFPFTSSQHVSVVTEQDILKEYNKRSPTDAHMSLDEFRRDVLRQMREVLPEYSYLYKSIRDMPGVGILIIPKEYLKFSYITLFGNVIFGLTIVFGVSQFLEFLIRRREVRKS